MKDTDLSSLSNLVIKKIHYAITGYNHTGAKNSRRNRTHWAIVIRHEGETVYRSGNKTVVSNRTHPVILPKSCSYDWECTEGGHFRIIEFDCDAEIPEPIGFNLKNSDRMMSIIEDLEHKRNIKSDTVELESIRDTYSALLILLQSVEKTYIPGEKRKKIAPALEYISQNYNKNITNDTLAQLVGVSTVYFRRLFHSVMGTSPIAYAKELRIKKAKVLLESDYGTLSEIATLLGYPSIYDFSRDFKAHVGVSPSKYSKGSVSE